MSARVNQIVLFDDNSEELAHRETLLERSLENLRLRDGLDLTQLPIRTSTRRSDTLDALEDEPNSLLIADMKSDARAQDAGNIGARLVRAVAQRASVSATTRRVIWSRHNLSQIVLDLEPWTHAFVLYRQGGERHLANGIAHVHGAGADDDPAAFPAARSEEEWGDQVKAVLVEHVGEPLKGDDIIGLGLALGLPNDVINERLRRGRRLDDTGRHRANANALLTAVVEHAKRRDIYLDVDDARARIVGPLLPIAVPQVADAIEPKVVTQALAFYERLRTERPNGGHLEVLWITAGEDDLVATFFALYRAQEQDGPAHRGNMAQRRQWIDNILGSQDEDDDEDDDLEDAPHPDFQAAKDRTGLGEKDLAHVLWTIRDVNLDR